MAFRRPDIPASRESGSRGTPSHITSEDENSTLDLYIETLVTDQKNARYHVPPSPFHQPDSFDIYSGLDENSQSASDSATLFQAKAQSSSEHSSPDSPDSSPRLPTASDRNLDPIGDAVMQDSGDPLAAEADRRDGTDKPSQQSTAPLSSSTFAETVGPSSSLAYQGPVVPHRDLPIARFRQESAEPHDIHEQVVAPTREGYLALLNKHRQLKANMVILLTCFQQQIVKLQEKADREEQNYNQLRDRRLPAASSYAQGDRRAVTSVADRKTALCQTDISMESRSDLQSSLQSSMGFNSRRVFHKEVQAETESRGASSQTDTLDTAEKQSKSASIQTDPIDTKENKKSRSASIQTEPVRITENKKSRSAYIQTDKTDTTENKKTRAASIQTDKIDTTENKKSICASIQTDSLYTTENKKSRSASIQTDPLEITEKNNSVVNLKHVETQTVSQSSAENFSLLELSRKVHNENASSERRSGSRGKRRSRKQAESDQNQSAGYVGEVHSDVSSAKRANRKRKVMASSPPSHSVLKKPAVQKLQNSEPSSFPSSEPALPSHSAEDRTGISDLSLSDDNEDVDFDEERGGCTGQLSLSVPPNQAPVVFHASDGEEASAHGHRTTRHQVHEAESQRHVSEHHAVVEPRHMHQAPVEGTSAAQHASVVPRRVHKSAMEMREIASPNDTAGPSYPVLSSTPHEDGENWRRNMLLWPVYSDKIATQRKVADAVYYGDSEPLVYEYTQWKESEDHDLHLNENMMGLAENEAGVQEHGVSHGASPNYLHYVDTHERCPSSYHHHDHQNPKDQHSFQHNEDQQAVDAEGESFYSAVEEMNMSNANTSVPSHLPDAGEAPQHETSSALASTETSHKTQKKKKKKEKKRKTDKESNDGSANADCKAKKKAKKDSKKRKGETSSADVNIPENVQLEAVAGAENIEGTVLTIHSATEITEKHRDAEIDLSTEATEQSQITPERTVHETEPDDLQGKKTMEENAAHAEKSQEKTCTEETVPEKACTEDTVPGKQASELDLSSSSLALSSSSSTLTLDSSGVQQTGNKTSKQSNKKDGKKKKKKGKSNVNYDKMLEKLFTKGYSSGIESQMSSPKFSEQESTGVRQKQAEDKVVDKTRNAKFATSPSEKDGPQLSDGVNGGNALHDENQYHSRLSGTKESVCFESSQAKQSLQQLNFEAENSAHQNLPKESSTLHPSTHLSDSESSPIEQPQPVHGATLSDSDSPFKAQHRHSTVCSDDEENSPAKQLQPLRQAAHVNFDVLVGEHQTPIQSELESESSTKRRHPHSPPPPTSSDISPDSKTANKENADTNSGDAGFLTQQQHKEVAQWAHDDDTMLDYVDNMGPQDHVTPTKQLSSKSSKQGSAMPLTPRSLEKVKNTHRLLSQSSFWSPEKSHKLHPEESMTTQTYHDLLGLASRSSSGQSVEETGNAPVTTITNTIVQHLHDDTARDSISLDGGRSGKSKSDGDRLGKFKTGDGKSKMAENSQKSKPGSKLKANSDGPRLRSHSSRMSLVFSEQTEKQTSDHGSNKDKESERRVKEVSKKLFTNKTSTDPEKLNEEPSTGKVQSQDKPSVVDNDEENAPLFGYPSDPNMHKEAARLNVRYSRAPKFLAFSSSSSSVTSSTKTSASSSSSVLSSTQSSTALSDQPTPFSFKPKLGGIMEEEDAASVAGSTGFATPIGSAVYPPSFQFDEYGPDSSHPLYPPGYIPPHIKIIGTEKYIDEEGREQLKTIVQGGEHSVGPYSNSNSNSKASSHSDIQEKHSPSKAAHFAEVTKDKQTEENSREMNVNHEKMGTSGEDDTSDSNDDDSESSEQSDDVSDEEKSVTASSKNSDDDADDNSAAEDDSKSQEKNKNSIIVGDSETKDAVAAQNKGVEMEKQLSKANLPQEPQNLPSAADNAELQSTNIAAPRDDLEEGELESSEDSTQMEVGSQVVRSEELEMTINIPSYKRKGRESADERAQLCLSNSDRTASGSKRRDMKSTDKRELERVRQLRSSSPEETTLELRNSADERQRRRVQMCPSSSERTASDPRRDRNMTDKKQRGNAYEERGEKANTQKELEDGARREKDREEKAKKDKEGVEIVLTEEEKALKAKKAKELEAKRQKEREQQDMVRQQIFGQVSDGVGPGVSSSNVSLQKYKIPKRKTSDASKRKEDSMRGMNKTVEKSLKDESRGDGRNDSGKSCTADNSRGRKGGNGDRCETDSHSEKFASKKRDEEVPSVGVRGSRKTSFDDGRKSSSGDAGGRQSASGDRGVKSSAPGEWKSTSEERSSASGNRRESTSVDKKRESASGERGRDTEKSTSEGKAKRKSNSGERKSTSEDKDGRKSFGDTEHGKSVSADGKKSRETRQRMSSSKDKDNSEVSTERSSRISNSTERGSKTSKERDPKTGQSSDSKVSSSHASDPREGNNSTSVKVDKKKKKSIDKTEKSDVAASSTTTTFSDKTHHPPPKMVVSHEASNHSSLQAQAPSSQADAMDVSDTEDSDVVDVEKMSQEDDNPVPAAQRLLSAKKSEGSCRTRHFHYFRDPNKPRPPVHIEDEEEEIEDEQEGDEDEDGDEKKDAEDENKEEEEDEKDRDSESGDGSDDDDEEEVKEDVSKEDERKQDKEHDCREESSSSESDDDHQEEVDGIHSAQLVDNGNLKTTEPSNNKKTQSPSKPEKEASAITEVQTSKLSDSDSQSHSSDSSGSDSDSEEDVFNTVDSGDDSNVENMGSSVNQRETASTIVSGGGQRSDTGFSSQEKEEKQKELSEGEVEDTDSEDEEKESPASPVLSHASEIESPDSPVGVQSEQLPSRSRSSLKSGIHGLCSEASADILSLDAFTGDHHLLLVHSEDGNTNSPDPKRFSKDKRGVDPKTSNWPDFSEKGVRSVQKQLSTLYRCTPVTDTSTKAGTRVTQELESASVPISERLTRLSMNKLRGASVNAAQGLEVSTKETSKKLKFQPDSEKRSKSSTKSPPSKKSKRDLRTSAEHRMASEHIQHQDSSNAYAGAHERTVAHARHSSHRPSLEERSREPNDSGKRRRRSCKSPERDRRERKSTEKYDREKCDRASRGRNSRERECRGNTDRKSREDRDIRERLSANGRDRKSRDERRDGDREKHICRDPHGESAGHIECSCCKQQSSHRKPDQHHRSHSCTTEHRVRRISGGGISSTHTRTHSRSRSHSRERRHSGTHSDRGHPNRLRSQSPERGRGQTRRSRSRSPERRPPFLSKKGKRMLWGLKIEGPLRHRTQGDCACEQCIPPVHSSICPCYNCRHCSREGSPFRHREQDCLCEKCVPPVHSNICECFSCQLARWKRSKPPIRTQRHSRSPHRSRSPPQLGSYRRSILSHHRRSPHRSRSPSPAPRSLCSSKSHQPRSLPTRSRSPGEARSPHRSRSREKCSVAGCDCRR